MKQIFCLIIAAVASATTVSAQAIPPVSISHVSLLPLSMTLCGLLNNMHSLRKHQKVSDIRNWVSALFSFRIIAHVKNQNKPLVALVLVNDTPWLYLLYSKLSLRRTAFQAVRELMLHVYLSVRRWK